MVAFGINRALPFFIKSEFADISLFKNEIEAFEASLKEERQFIQERQLFYFDPNSIDSAGFAGLGIKPVVISRILKYRQKGGIFREQEDFSRIYGLDEDLFYALKPYIRIERMDKIKTPITQEKKKEKKVKVRMKKTFIELNSADVIILKKLKGIGTIYAERIIKYRDYLGGFHNVSQIKEVYGISEELFHSFEPEIMVDTTLIKKIRINGGDLTRKLKHPYLKKQQIEELIAYRRKNQVINSIETIREMDIFSKEDIDKLKPYLSFE
jgi:competence ComEA-like helix-hairpin-helix protein